MRYRELTPADDELISQAFEVIRRNYREDSHHVGSAVRTRSGDVYAGVHMESPGQDVCAEWVALGMAVSSGQREFTCIVAVRPTGPDGSMPGVMSPCGICRELLNYYAPDIDVIVPAPDGPAKVKISELLPLPYASSRPPEPV